MAITKANLKRGSGKPIKKGQVLNPLGRPKGSKNKLGEDFIAAVAADFEIHGVEVIRIMRKIDPVSYVKVVAGLVPKDMNVNVGASEEFSKIWKAISGNAA